MGDSIDVATATERWRLSAENVVDFAELAAPVGENEFAPFLDKGIGDPQNELDARIDQLLSDSDKAVDATDNREGTDILLGNLEVANVLLAASQEPSILFGELDADNRPIAFGMARARLAELEESASILPESVKGKFDELQNAGGSELVALALSPTVQSAVVGGIGSIIIVIADKADDAFEKLKSALVWLKNAAIRVIEWIVNKLRSLLPASFQTKFDELITKLRETLADGAPAAVGSLLGAVLGRPDAEKAWKALSADQSAALEPSLDETVKRSLRRIAYVTSAREAVDKFEIILAALSGADLAPQLKIAALALIVAVIGFVGYQVWDGFHEAEALAV